VRLVAEPAPKTVPPRRGLCNPHRRLSEHATCDKARCARLGGRAENLKNAELGRRKAAEVRRAKFVQSVNPGALVGRCIPEVAANADWNASPYLLVVDGGAQPNGGTSAATSGGRR
jgi:hypothetical protein